MYQQPTQGLKLRGVCDCTTPQIIWTDYQIRLRTYISMEKYSVLHLRTHKIKLPISTCSNLAKVVFTCFNPDSNLHVHDLWSTIGHI